MYAGPVGELPDKPMVIIYTVTFSLQSKLQPDVFRLGCQYWAAPLAGTDLSLTEVRQALKPLFVLKLR